MIRFVVTVFLAMFAALPLPATRAYADPIYHNVSYPDGSGPFPTVIALHTSGGFKTIQEQIGKYTRAGYAVYAPDFFQRHGLSSSNRFETWTTYRTPIESELIEIVELIKKDPKVDPKNIFAVGFSNGGYWASFLAAKKYVNAGSSHYGVWAFPNHNGYPADYFDQSSNPVLALHGENDTVQKPKFVIRQIEKVAALSPNFKYHIFKNVGHSWDCGPCQKDGYDRETEKTALKMTLEFFDKYKR